MADRLPAAARGLALVLASALVLTSAHAGPRQASPAPVPANPKAPSPGALVAAERGAALFEDRQYAAALVELEKALAGGVRDGRTLFRAGESQRQTGKSRADVMRTLSEAVTALDGTVRGGGKPALLDFTYLASAYAGIGDSATAAKVAREGLDAYRRGDLGVVTEMPAADHLRLGRLASLAGDVQLRQAFYGRAVQRLDADGKATPAVLAQALSELGSAQLDAGNPAAAVNTLGRLMEAGPPPAGARTVYARALFRKGDYDEAARQWSALRAEQPALATEATYAMMIMRTLSQDDLLRDKERPLEDVKTLSRADLETRMDELAAEIQEVAAELPPELAKRGYARKDSDPTTVEAMQRLRDLKLRLAWAAAEYIVRGLPIREFAFASGMQSMLRNYDLPKDPQGRVAGAPPPLDIVGPAQRAEYEAARSGKKQPAGKTGEEPPASKEARRD